MVAVATATCYAAAVRANDLDAILSDPATPAADGHMVGRHHCTYAHPRGRDLTAWAYRVRCPASADPGRDDGGRRGGDRERRAPAALLLVQLGRVAPRDLVRPRY